MTQTYDPIGDFLRLRDRYASGWTGPASLWTDALRMELESWLGTPYVAGQGLCKVAADCVGFGAGVYDALEGIPAHAAPELPRHSQDVAFNNGREAARLTARIRRRWPAVAIVWRRGQRKWGRQLTPDMIQPGDALIVAVNRGAPGHMMIAGTRPGELFHAQQDAGVVRAGAGQYLGRVVRVWRSMNRERWNETWRPSSSR